MIELPNFLWARLLTQLGSLEFRGMFQVHFFPFGHLTHSELKIQFNQTKNRSLKSLPIQAAVRVFFDREPLSGLGSRASTTFN
jgi:hypothetical protein